MKLGYKYYLFFYCTFKGEHTKIVVKLAKKLKDYLSMMIEIFKNEQKLVDYMIDLIEKMQLKLKIN